MIRRLAILLHSSPTEVGRKKYIKRDLKYLNSNSCASHVILVFLLNKYASGWNLQRDTDNFNTLTYLP